ncbi:hypothetical protein [Paenibacillus sp. L3-i20]|uniref:hypothetical protein n=1 Tax=Paenibacillus sp. L3-i20 TaxID=2905833 RepID=UPI0020C02FA9|nr:hypothetical protein [Paenibacillus sp. L3-i20]
MELLRLWLICLTEASHTERNQMIGKQIVQLQPGQFVTGRFDLHDMYNAGLKCDQKKSAKTIWRWLETLQRGDFLTIQSTTKFSVVTICNWDLYQEHKSDNDQQITNKRPSNDQQVTINKNVNHYNNDNNDNNEEKKRLSERKRYAEDSTSYRMAAFLFSKIKEWTSSVKQPDFQLWADDFRKIVEIDKRETELVKIVIEWVTEDTFWRKNILCPSKLRKQFDRLVIEMESKAGKLKKTQSCGGEMNERRSDNGSDIVGSEQNYDLFVRR